jgi:predicted RNA polymerase sigma factor
MAAAGVGARAAAERVAREAYGRLLARLTARTRDLSLAEDALADALEQAVRRWPRDGIPRQPEAWVLAVARNRWLNGVRDDARRPRVPVEWLDEIESTLALRDHDALPDSHLGLMFACAHPAIDPGVRTALMLQTVLGVPVQVIARAFALPAATLTQRLVRAKRRLRDARIPFDVPAPQRLAQRLPDVLEAIYAAFAIDWQRAAYAGGVTDHESLTREAVFLATLLARLLPGEPEVLGLAALVCLSASRSQARHDADGRLVPLAEQDCRRWERGLIDAGEDLLHRAHAHGRPARFQIEAAIQSLHCARATTGRVDRTALLTLHRALVAIAPSAGAHVALAAVLGDVLGAPQGLLHLARCDAAHFADFQPYWATRAALSRAAGDVDDACACVERALALTDDPATCRLLEESRASPRLARGPVADCAAQHAAT